MDIVSRLKQFIDELNIPVTQFADNCGIPRPTLSQLLNGRNKTVRNELITKIHDAYPSFSVLWLLFGEGSMWEDAAGKGLAANPPVATFTYDDPFPGEEGPIYKTARSSAPTSSPTQTQAQSQSQSQTQSQTQTPAKLPHSIDFSIDESPASPASPAQPGSAAREEEIKAVTLDFAGDSGTDETAEPAEAAETPDLSAAPAHATRGAREIVRIIVYYNDNSYQAFVPDKLTPAAFPL